jgi:hypothetical protein
MKKLDVPQSGSQGQTTASRNRFGQYDRQRSMPTQPRTAAQVGVRSQLSEVSQDWRELTDAERAAWGAYAAAHPRVDVLGQTIVLTGHQMFVAVNVFNRQAYLASQTAVPDGTVIAPANISLSDETAAALELVAMDAIPVTDKILVFASPPQSPGRSFIGDTRLVNVVTGTNAANQVILNAAALTAKYGALTANMKFKIEVYVLRAGNVSTAAAVTFVTD